MIKKSIAIGLVLLMVLNVFPSQLLVNKNGISFAVTNDYYEYNPDGQEGTGYYFNDGTGQVDGNSGNVFFSHTEDGTVMVQDYDVSDIGWMSGNQHLWSRNNMFSERRALGISRPVTTAQNYGYGIGSNIYYTGYIFYTNANWNGSMEQGGMSKTARRIWGYYTADKTGYYQFKVSTDDGHYINFYKDDIFYNPKYDHYDTGDYNRKWDRYYENGINPVKNIDKDKPQGTMIVTGNVTTTLKPIYMRKGEVYPFFIEYFNWGGGGKFYFDERYKRFNNSKWSSYHHINPKAMHPKSANNPRIPGNSGLDLTVENGVRTYHGYDNFNGETIDKDVWENINGFSISNGALHSNGGLSSIKLKKNYKYYDSYEMTIDLVNIANQDLNHSNGGIGISSDDKIWAHNIKMTQGENNSKWYKTYDITKYGSISNSNVNGDFLRPPVTFDEKISPNQLWQNRPIKLEIKAKRSDEIDVYDVITTLYYVDGDKEKLKEITESYSMDELDFNHIYLTAIAPENNWLVAFDNFDFVAKKNLKFDSLKVKWEKHKYLLEWDLVPGATSYTVHYQVGIDSTGKPIIKEYPLSNSDKDDVALGKLYIPDGSPYCNHPFKVIAKVKDYESSSDKTYDMTSNTVYVGGKASDLTLKGGFNGNNYIASWDDLQITHKDKIKNYTYSLFYHTDDDATLIPVEGAQGMDKSSRNFTFRNLQTSSEYYGKHLVLVVDADYGNNDIIKYYSNSVLIEGILRLGISHVADKYILDWKTNTVFDFYKLHRAPNILSYKDKNNINSPYVTVLKSSPIIDTKGYAYVKVSDTDLEYINKYYIVLGLSNNNLSYSNIVYAEGDETVPTLEWIRTNDGHNLFQWDAFEGATEVELYYGTTADEINNRFGQDGNLLLDNKYKSISSEHDDKYVQVRFLKNGIWYYSNIVRTLAFDDIGGVIENNLNNSEQYDFTIDWKDVVWPEDGEDLSNRVSYYEVYYLDDSNKEVLIQKNLIDSHYTITDIYDKNSDYLNKEIYVKAICPIKDKFGIEYKGTLISPKVIPRRIRFDQLNGILDKSSKYKLTWKKPILLLDDSNKEINADSYDILFGATKDAITGKAVADIVNPNILEQEWLDVTKTGVNKEYYHKFFKVKAKIDNVNYLSNTVYSGEKPDLHIDRFNNDFKLNWNLIEHADAIKIYYAKNDTDTYKLYDMAKLNGDAVVYVLENMANNEDYDNNYYKIAAVFDGFEIESNSVKVDSSMALPVLKGKYNPETGSYDTWWEVIDWANGGYQFYYEEEKSDDANVDDSKYIKMPESEYLLNKDVNKKQFENIEINTYNGKHIRIRAISGNYTAYSNAVSPRLPALVGELEDLFSEDRVEIQLSNSIDIVYTFNVYKDMREPYFKMFLKGTKYLKFDKISAYLEKIENGTRSDLPIRLVTQFDENSGLTTLYAYLLGDSPIFVADKDVQYRLVISTSVEVNEKREEEVYNALKDFKANAENWELLYHLADDGMTIDGQAFGKDMSIKYEANWNVDDRTLIDNKRQSSSELFEVDVYMKNKSELPSSL